MFKNGASRFGIRFKHPQPLLGIDADVQSELSDMVAGVVGDALGNGDTRSFEFVKKSFGFVAKSTPQCEFGCQQGAPIADVGRNASFTGFFRTNAPDRPVVFFVAHEVHAKIDRLVLYRHKANALLYDRSPHLGVVAREHVPKPIDRGHGAHDVLSAGAQAQRVAFVRLADAHDAFAQAAGGRLHVHGAVRAQQMVQRRRTRIDDGVWDVRPNDRICGEFTDDVAFSKKAPIKKWYTQPQKAGFKGNHRW